MDDGNCSTRVYSIEGFYGSMMIRRTGKGRIIVVVVAVAGDRRGLGEIAFYLIFFFVLNLICETPSSLENKPFTLPESGRKSRI